MVSMLFSPLVVLVLLLHRAEAGTWSTAELSEGRSYITTVTTDRYVFFAGGYNDRRMHQFVDNVDIYDSQTNTWSLTHMSEKRSGNCMATAVVKDSVYFIGGCDSYNGDIKCTDRMEVYDTTTGKWNILTSEYNRICHHPKTITVDDTFILIFNEPRSTQRLTVYAYDIKQNEWTPYSFTPYNGPPTSEIMSFSFSREIWIWSSERYYRVNYSIPESGWAQHLINRKIVLDNIDVQVLTWNVSIYDIDLGVRQFHVSIPTSGYFLLIPGTNKIGLVQLSQLTIVNIDNMMMETVAFPNTTEFYLNGVIFQSRVFFASTFVPNTLLLMDKKVLIYDMDSQSTWKSWMTMSIVISVSITLVLFVAGFIYFCCVKRTRQDDLPYAHLHDSSLNNISTV